MFYIKVTDDCQMIFSNLESACFVLRMYFNNSNRYAPVFYLERTQNAHKRRLCITNYSCLNRMNIDEYLMTFNSTKVQYHHSSVAEAAVVC